MVSTSPEALPSRASLSGPERSDAAANHPSLPGTAVRSGKRPAEELGAVRYSRHGGEGKLLVQRQAVTYCRETAVRHPPRPNPSRSAPLLPRNLAESAATPKVRTMVRGDPDQGAAGQDEIGRTVRQLAQGADLGTP